MSQSSPLLPRLKNGARRFVAGVRPGHLAIVAALAVVAVGIGVARTMALPVPQPVLDGERMTIQVVAPVEPEITPGSVMEVGDLVEGFEYRRPVPALSDTVDEAPWDLEFETPAPRRVSQRDDAYDMEPVSAPTEAPPEERRDARADRWFGFDAPDRDYRAEREARRARIDARIERDRARREVRWYHSDGRPAEDGEPGGDRDLRPR